MITNSSSIETLTTSKLLPTCNVQDQLYKKPIWGYRNYLGIKISKLRLYLQTIFPIQTNVNSLDFINTKTSTFPSSKENETTRFNIILNIISYSTSNNIVHINNSSTISIPLMDLPTLTTTNNIIRNNVRKTLITQLTDHPTIRAKRDKNYININFTSPDGNYLNINVKGIDATITINEHETNYITLLTSLGTKTIYMFKIIAKLFQIFYWKGGWWKIKYLNKFNLPNPNKYNVRRNLRSIPLPSHTNLGQTFYKINANKNTPTIIKLTSQPTHYLPNLSNVVRTWRETKTIKTFLSLTTKQVKERKDYNLLKTNISNIWLTDGGRVALNNIMDYQLNSSFDLLTQNDLLTIFKKLTPHCILKIINNYKSATGIGNMVLEAITILIETHLNLPTTFNLINKNSKTLKLKSE